MRISKKIVAIALSVLMAVSMMPFTVFAATTTVANGAELKAAVAAAADGDVIEFTADNTTYPATAGALVIPVDGKDITIDLKGHTQYFRVSGETAVSYPTDLFVLKNGAKLTVKDSVGGGAIYATYGANSAAYIFNVLDTSELVIESGKYVMDQANYGGIIVYQNSADASTTINDGEFEVKTGATARRDRIVSNARGELEINGGTFTTPRDFDQVISTGSSQSTVVINDGEFNGTMDMSSGTKTLNGGTYLTYDGQSNGAVAAYLPADKVIDANGEIASVASTTVARINSVEYTSLTDAVAACTNTSSTTTITMLKDTTEAAPITISNGAKITINANGCKVTCTDRVFIIRHGQLTFNNGTINSTTDDGVAVYGAATDSGSNYSTFTLGTDAVINAPNYFGAMIGSNNGGAYGAKITINSTATVNSKYGIYINGSVAEPETKTNAALITINGTVNGDNAEAAIYAAGYAKWSIGTTSYTANITAGSGIYIKSGDMTITNANITATGAKTDYVFNTNGADGTGDAIIIDSCGYPGNVPTVTVKAGTITSANGEAVASYAKQDDPLYPTAEYPRVDNVVPATSTAVFSSDVSDLAAEGYETVYDSEKGGYVIAEDTHTVAKIGNAKYDTVAAAVAAAPTDGTQTVIKLVADSTSTKNIGVYGGTWSARTGGKNIVLDLNGHTYTQNNVNGTGAFVLAPSQDMTESNSLTITDTSDGKNGKITSNTQYTTIQVGSNCTFTLEAGTIENTGDGTAIQISGTGAATINDGTVTVEDGYAIYMYEASGNTTPSLEIAGGEINAYAAVSTEAEATVDMNGGTINADYAFIVDEDSTVNVTGGTVDATYIGYNYTDTSDINISGGTFSTEVPAEYCADGFIPVTTPNAQGMYEVTPDTAENGYSVVADSTTSMKAYIDVASYADEATAKVEVTYNNNEDGSSTGGSIEADTTTDTITNADAEKQSGGTYDGNWIINIEQAPAQMNDEITIEIYDGDTLIKTITTSIVDYCLQAAEELPAGEEKELVKAMYDYGKAIYEAGGFTGGTYTAENFEHAFFNTAAPDFSQVTAATAESTETFSFVNFAFVATSTPSLRVYTNLTADDAAVLGYNTETAPNAYIGTNDKVFIDLGAIRPEDFDEQKTATLGNASAQVSVLNYAQAAYNKGVADSNAQNIALGRSLYNYNVAAEAYFE